MARYKNGRNRFGHKLKSDINVTPFVDVMLVLLIIFLVTSPMLISGVDVKLPQAKAQQIKQNSDMITITITSEAAVYVNDNAVEIDSVVSALEEISEDYSVKVLIKGDRDVDYGSVLKVFAQLKNSQFENIGLLTSSADVSVRDKKSKAKPNN